MPWLPANCHTLLSGATWYCCKLPEELHGGGAARAVLYLVIGFYPALTASLGSGGDITEQAWAMLGKSVILLVAVFMSGRFTKAITSAI